MIKPKQTAQRRRMTIHTTKVRDGVPSHQVMVYDPYSGIRHATGRVLVRGYTNFLEWYLRNRPHIPFDHKKNLARKLSYLPKGMKAWAPYMPGGFATYYASEPHHKKMANGARLDIITRNFFKHTYDAVGLRSRSAILSALVDEYIATHGNQPIRWVSIAAGAGQHVYSSLESLPDSALRRLAWTYVDIDSDIHALAQSLYVEHPRKLMSTEFLLKDVFDDGLLSYIKDLSPTIIDMLGLCDYIDDERLTKLLHALYSLMPKGAILVFSNMNSDRPHLHVHQRAVGWPGVIPRSVEQMVAMLHAAGVVHTHITTYCPQDKVYTVYKVQKT